VIDEQDAVEMVDLVLQAVKQPRRFDLARRSLRIRYLPSPVRAAQPRRRSQDRATSS
jgi:hypothetical protein